MLRVGAALIGGKGVIFHGLLVGLLDAVARFIEPGQIVLRAGIALRRGERVVLRGLHVVLIDALAIFEQQSQVVLGAGVALRRGERVVFCGLCEILFDAEADLETIAHVELRVDISLPGRFLEDGHGSFIIAILVSHQSASHGIVAVILRFGLRGIIGMGCPAGCSLIHRL